MRTTARSGSRNAYYSTELVVALEHVDEVARTLQHLGVALGDVRHSDGLGLALVPLRDDRAAAASVVAAAGLDQAPHVVGLDSDMDRLLVGVRDYFARRYAGWVPTLGKNRLLGDVIGSWKISHGGTLFPEATHQRLPERPSQPGRGVRVGVLDTSIAAHPWLAGGWVASSQDVWTASGPAPVVAGHATFVTGLVLQQAPGSVVEVRQVLSDEDGAADSWTVANEIVELGRAGVDILNLSLVCHTEDGQAPLALSTAVERLDPGTVVVAAAGNHGDTDEGDDENRRKPAWPAALDHVVAVGAADAQGTPAGFTPADVPWVDVLAPGVDVVSTYLEGDVELEEGAAPRRFEGFASWSGTSFAAASVSGAVAARTRPGRVSAREAWQQLRDSASASAGEGPAFLPLDS